MKELVVCCIDLGAGLVLRVAVLDKQIAILAGCVGAASVTRLRNCGKAGT
jgi:hypothetical protein